MKIEMNTIYHLPTKELREDFLTKCEEIGLKWADGTDALKELDAHMYGSETCINTTHGSLLFAEKGFYQEEPMYHYTSIVKWEAEAPKVQAKPTVIKLPNGHKIVFNPPYTLYTDGKVTGKAKCNPADEYKAEVGLKLAVERYQKAKTEKIFKVTFQNDRHYGLPETVSATLSKKIDEEIWGMFTRAIGGNR